MEVDASFDGKTKRTSDANSSITTTQKRIADNESISSVSTLSSPLSMMTSLENVVSQHHVISTPVESSSMIANGTSNKMPQRRSQIMKESWKKKRDSTTSKSHTGVSELNKPGMIGADGKIVPRLKACDQNLPKVIKSNSSLLFFMSYAHILDH